VTPQSSMAFDPVFARDVLVPLNTTAYQLFWAQALTFPAVWQQPGVVTADQSVIDRETASGLAKIVISEDPIGASSRARTMSR
jgi:hypothetical protein